MNTCDCSLRKWLLQTVLSFQGVIFIWILVVVYPPLLNGGDVWGLSLIPFSKYGVSSICWLVAINTTFWMFYPTQSVLRYLRLWFFHSSCPILVSARMVKSICTMLESAHLVVYCWHNVWVSVTLKINDCIFLLHYLFLHLSLAVF